MVKSMRARRSTMYLCGYKAYIIIVIALLGFLLCESRAYAKAKKVKNNSKITICHIPPGNPDNPQTISVNQNAVSAHLAHGDTLGSCSNTGTAIGPAGGIAVSDDGMASVEIPAGALSEDIEITILPIGGGGLVDQVYEFGPSGLNFSTPITISIKYDPTSLPDNVNEDDLFLAYVDEYMEIMSDIEVDTTNKIVSGKGTHFSSIAQCTPLSTGVKVSKFDVDNIIAKYFRVPIGDSWDLGNLIDENTTFGTSTAFGTDTASCGYDYPRNYGSEDLGTSTASLKLSNWTNFNYPKISFNKEVISNGWYVATAFNQNRYLNNGWGEPSDASFDNTCGRKLEDGGDLSSIYSNSCDKTLFHPGEDWNLIEGSDGGKPIHAIADGIILFNQKQWSPSSKKDDKTIGFGNIIVIGHKLSDGSIIASVYAHMQDLSPCSVGETVSKGDIIGLIGTTGASAGNHLHFEIIKTNVVDNAASKVGEEGYNTPLIDKVTGEIYIRHHELVSKVSGWYWPKKEGIINNNYENPSLFIKSASDTLVTYNLPDTGQVGDYTAIVGEDSDYTINPPSYTDNGDGTVTDNNTGLMWQKEDDNNIYIWDNAVSYSENLSLAGYDDWRLPTIKELVDIVDYEKYYLTINSTYFSNTNSSFYWSSTLGSPTDYAMVVSFLGGGVIYNRLPSYVRCVRGGNYPNESFTDNNDSTITDNNTGLMWQKEDDSVQRAWSDAVFYAENLSLAGHADWRLPNTKELKSIVSYKGSSPSINETYFLNTKWAQYWSSTAFVHNANWWWYVNFGSGNISETDWSRSYYVRCVRGGE